MLSVKLTPHKMAAARDLVVALDYVDDGLIRQLFDLFMEPEDTGPITQEMVDSGPTEPMIVAGGGVLMKSGYKNVEASEQLAIRVFRAMLDPYGVQPKPSGLITEDETRQAIYDFCRSQDRTANLEALIPIIEGFLRWNEFDDLARAVAITPVWIETGLSPDASTADIHAAAEHGGPE